MSNTKMPIVNTRSKKFLIWSAKRHKPQKKYPKMKFNKKVSSARRNNRKAHFTADSTERRIRMSSPLSRELRAKYGFKSFPIRIKDKVTVMSGKFKGKTGSIVSVRRRSYKVFVDTCERSKVNGQAIKVGIDASNCLITELTQEFDRPRILEKKKVARAMQVERLNRA